MDNQSRIALMTDRLETAFSPASLNIIDNSRHHEGHAGAQSGAGHFRVEIQADTFEGVSKIKCHQMIYKELGDMIPDEIHALEIKVL